MSGAGNGSGGANVNGGPRNAQLKQLWPVIGPLIGLVAGLLINLVDNERETAKGVSFQQGKEIGRALGIEEERKRWMTGPGFGHPEAPNYRDPYGTGPNEAGRGQTYQGEGGSR